MCPSWNGVQLKFYGYMIVKDEADRYLHSALSHLSSICDEVLVVDDHSSDDSVAVASSFDKVTVVSAEDSVSFALSEGQLRNFAWGMLGEIFDISEDDWIFAIDADEQILGSKQDWVELLSRIEAPSVRVFIPEAWSLDPVKFRTDGFWASNYPYRISKYHGYISNSIMGGGSVPYLQSEVIEDPMIVHYGYATADDRLARYNRYTSRKNTNGHNPVHIDSIVRNPTLTDWNREIPPFERRVR